MQIIYHIKLSTLDEDDFGTWYNSYEKKRVQSRINEKHKIKERPTDRFQVSTLTH